MTDAQIAAIQAEIMALDADFGVANGRVDRAFTAMQKASDELADARVARADLYAKQQSLYRRHIAATGRIVAYEPPEFVATLADALNGAHVEFQAHIVKRFEAVS